VVIPKRCDIGEFACAWCNPSFSRVLIGTRKRIFSCAFLAMEGPFRRTLQPL
jgi:hypothetical protein